MAREEKRFELKPVADPVNPKAPVVRLELPAREDFQPRTHRPGPEALVEKEAADPDFMEHDWGKESNHRKRPAWGWFAVIGIVLSSGVLWSLYGVKEADAKAGQIRSTTEAARKNDAEEDLEAGRLIEKMGATAREFFECASVDALARLVRHPERVRPLMDDYYRDKPLTANRVLGSNLFRPLTVENQTNFWMTTVELADHSSRNLIIETNDSGEPLIDWETLVCYQPMEWDEFARQRPAGTSLDFRVYVEADNFFSHEFADPGRWSCFRLTALDSDETLFGYAPADGAVAKSLLNLSSHPSARKVPVILRLIVPGNLQSRRGVVIEKLLSPQWLYTHPPEA